MKDRFFSFWNNYGVSIKFGTLIFSVTRLWLTLFSVIIFFKIPLLTRSQSWAGYYDVIPLLTGWPGALLGMWQRWDTIHYQAISQWGYNQPYLTAFFPGYPMLGHAISRLLNISDLAGLLVVSNTFAWLSLILLHQIVKSLYDQQTANLTLFFLVTFPSSFFFFAGYPQSMVLSFVLFCYWQAKKNHWFWVALAGLAAGLTHGTVVPLSLMLAWQAIQTLKQTRFSLRWVVALVPFLSLSGIALFLSWRSSQGFESYSSLLWHNWSRMFQLPWNALILGINKLISSLEIITFINCLIGLLLIFTGMWSLNRLPIELKIYTIALVIFLFSTGTSFNSLESLNRYALGVFPTFIYLAVVTSKNKILRLAILEFNVLFSIYFCYLFFTWRWVG